MRAETSSWRSLIFDRRLARAALAIGIALASIVSAQELPADHAERMQRGLKLFESGVAAVLKEHCVMCHGGDETESEFDLTTREGLLKGGSQGPAVVLWKGRDSLLYRLISHAEEPTMPMEGSKLPDETIDQIVAWIDSGAPYAQPLIDKQVSAAPVITDEQRRFWSFQPLKKTEPPHVEARLWCRTPIDHFILAAQETKGLRPNPPANRRKLIRRAYLDLLGLPPSPEEVEAFVDDPASDAYEILIDRLLASPHHGERWGRHWLDLARFAESHGYEQDYDRPSAYHYRDFVVQALNQDMPYDQFVRLQIAGDEFESDNPLAMTATGFLGAGTHATQITANQVEKERYDELDDMTATVGTAMLGLTIGCARCHDHKFDPIPQEDYYRLLSTFTTAVRSEINLDLHPDRYREAKAQFDRAHAPLAEALARFEREELPARMDVWLATKPAAPRPRWLLLAPETAKAVSGATLTPQADGSLLAAGGSSVQAEIYTLVAKTPLSGITAVRLEALPDPTLPKRGPGRAEDGNFVLSGFELSASPADSQETATQVKLANPQATFEQPEQLIAAAIDADKKSGWAVGPQAVNRHACLFELDPPLTQAGGATLTFTLRFEAKNGHAIGRLRLSISTAEKPAPLDGDEAPHDLVNEVTELLKIPVGEHTPEQRETLSRWYRTRDLQWQKLNQPVVEHLELAPQPQLTKAMVVSEGLPPIRLHTQGADFFEETYFLKRGDLKQKQGVATPGFLRVLMSAPQQENRWQVSPPEGWRTSYRRRALAAWLTDAEQGAGPLLARVIANRLWHHHLGRGIVATPSDFGAQGERPTHPELLDWLALSLIDGGWRLKPIHKLIMTSAVYMQTSDYDADRGRIDPDNRLFWRRVPRRLEAETIRDSMLAISGQLDPAMFGPGKLDEGHPRRSIYLTIKRSQLIPMMVLFDAPEPNQGLGNRPATTVAPQALALMNNPHVQSYAAGFAKRLLPKLAESPEAAIRQAYLIALARMPTGPELTDSVEFLEQQIAASGGNTDQNPKEQALADFCQALICLNEFLYVE